MLGQPNVPTMPMAASIRQPLPLSDALAPLGQPMPPMPPPQGAPPAMGAPAPQAPQAPQAPPMAPAAPSAPQPPYTVKLQADGSSVYVVPSPDGDPAKDIILGVNKAPKLPPQLAPQGVPLAMQPPAQ